MSRGLGVVLLGLLGGCTGLNPLYADGGTTGDTGLATTGETTGVNPLPTSSNPSAGPSTATFGSSGGDDSGVSPTDVGGESSSTSPTGPDDSGGQTTGPAPSDCNTYDQDCPLEEKCMPWANDAGDIWNALGCFPVETDPHVPGDACTVEGSGTSGYDNCDGTSMCWNVNLETNEGVCEAFCEGSPDSPVCGDPLSTCVQYNDGVIALCLSICDPLLQNCPGPGICAPAVDGFACVPDASGGEPQVGDPCKFVNACGAGFLCAGADVLETCAGIACCTSFCDLGEPEFCPEPQVCRPYFEKGSAPAGYEDVGFCGSPI